MDLKLHMQLLEVYMHEFFCLDVVDIQGVAPEVRQSGLFYKHPSYNSKTHIHIHTWHVHQHIHKIK